MYLTIQCLYNFAKKSAIIVAKIISRSLLQIILRSIYAKNYTYIYATYYAYKLYAINYT